MRFFNGGDGCFSCTYDRSCLGRVEREIHLINFVLFLLCPLIREHQPLGRARRPARRHRPLHPTPLARVVALAPVPTTIQVVHRAMRRSKAQALSPVVLVVQPGRLLIKGHPLVPRPLSILPRQRPAAPRHPALGHRPTRRASHRHPIIPGPRIMGPGRAHSARHLAALRSSSVDPAPRGRRSYLREPGILTFLRMVNRLAGPNMVCHLEARLDPATR